jgi:hypothetical protein
VTTLPLSRQQQMLGKGGNLPGSGETVTRVRKDTFRRPNMNKVAHAQLHTI